MPTTDMRAASKAFFTSTRYAVAGASSDPSKFGHKIFAWYLQNGQTPTPLNPRSASITVRSKSYPTLASPSALPEPSSTSLSVITPPAITRQLLKEAKEAGIKSVWLQPGSFDDEILEQAKRDFDAAVGGFEGLRRGEEHEGWCLLVHGVEAMEGAKEERGRGKL